MSESNEPDPTSSLRRCIRVLAALALFAASMPVSSSADLAVEEPVDPNAPELRATSMTFVGSRGSTSELILHSTTATFRPDHDRARLEDVRAVFTDDEAGESFELTCAHADLDIATNDFRAEGDVRGATADGQRYSAPWVEYDHEAGVLHTSAPVAMVDGTGTYRGDGFRYDVRERKFRLLGNVKVEQNQ